MGVRARAVALPLGWPGFASPADGWLRGALAGIGAALRGAFARELDGLDLVLVVPVCIGLGVIAYFTAPDEPGLAAPLAAAVGLAVLARLVRARYWLCFALICGLAFAAGFSAARLRTISVEAPQLTRPLTAMITGVVLSVDLRAKGGARFIMRPASIEGVEAAAMPALVRLTVRKAAGLAAGDSVTLKALLRPPPPPTLPGGYDFARDAFFDGIGAVGFVAGKVAPAEAPVTMSGTERFYAALDRSRNALTERITAIVPGENGAIAASQVTGKRGLIPDDANEALRASGLYHVVSISGLHMALFASGLFWLIRASLALSLRLTLTTPLKTIAAVLALIPAAGYTLFSGAEVATIRAFVMTAILLVAIALNRTAITRRNVGLAACFVLLTTPEQVLGPSFQMSFGAVAMLVAWYDRPSKPGRHGRMGASERLARRLLFVVLALAVTTIIASLATAPFSAFHFHRLTLQSLASNFMATPIVSFAIMPLAIAATAFEPFGWSEPFWVALGWCVGAFMWVARTVAGWPGSEIVTPQFSSAALAAFALALVLLAILRTRLAFVAAVPLAAGLALAATDPRPRIIIGANGYAALVRDGDQLSVVATRRDAFNVGAWLLAMGDKRKPDDPSLTARVRCDKEGCSAPLGQGQVLMLDRTVNAIDEDCGRVAVLVSPLRIPPRCAKTGLTIDRNTVLAAGSLAVFEDGDAGVSGWRIDRARDGGSRPWIRGHPPPSSSAPATGNAKEGTDDKEDAKDDGAAAAAD